MANTWFVTTGQCRGTHCTAFHSRAIAAPQTHRLGEGGPSEPQKLQGSKGPSPGPKHRGTTVTMGDGKKRNKTHRKDAMAGWLSWLEHHPIHQKVAGSIPGQGTYLG